MIIAAGNRLDVVTACIWQVDYERDIKLVTRDTLHGNAALQTFACDGL